MNCMPPPNRQVYYGQSWDLARKIPYGMVVTYGQLGQMLAPPEDYKIYGPRWVGDAMAE
jgi:alkylated DNA nucleotide flippase Atl1